MLFICQKIRKMEAGGRIFQYRYILERLWKDVCVIVCIGEISLQTILSWNLNI